jgi:hypothetical protein
MHEYRVKNMQFYNEYNNFGLGLYGDFNTRAYTVQERIHLFVIIYI